MEKHVWLIRHGESTAQVSRRSEPDPGLSLRGQEQARRLGVVLRGNEFSRIMVSPLRRARETFELSRANGRHVSFDSRLIECRFEIDYATLLPYATPECAQPDVYDAWLWSARRRVTVVLDEIRSSGDRSVLLVSHWGFLNLLLLTQLGGHIPEELDKKSLKFSAPMANCAISVVVLEHGKYGDALLRWNDCAHLDGLLDGPFRW